MWPFNKKPPQRSVKSKLLIQNEKVYIDVRGQSCPNFILSIQRALANIEPGIDTSLLFTYKPGNSDIRILCAARKVLVKSMVLTNGTWEMVVRKPIQAHEIEMTEITYRNFIGEPLDNHVNGNTKQ